jgi:hypothetical protein
MGGEGIILSTCPGEHQVDISTCEEEFWPVSVVESITLVNNNFLSLFWDENHLAWLPYVFSVYFPL